MIIKASTPEDMRKAIINWANNEASLFEIQSKKAVRVTIKKQLMAKAYSYKWVAEFWEKVIIES